MSKLVKKAAEHAQRKAHMEHTFKPNRLDDATVNKIIGFCILVTMMSLAAMVVAVMMCG